MEDEVDALVLGSGAAGLTAALTAAVAGLRVLVLEKTDRIGGTSAMSGAGTWIPANHHAEAAGIADSPAEALAYIRAAAPEGWAETEDALWQRLVTASPAMLRFVEAHSPLRFRLTPEGDPLRHLPGAKPRGRMLSPLPLSRFRAGRFAFRIRRSTIP
ncbi:MAG: dehydrogenase, partial [Rhodospirillales bacterium 12-71-4]